jgi:PAS domain-containing protein
VSRVTNDAVWDLDVATGAVQWNATVQTLFGYAADEVADDPSWWEERIHPDDRDGVLSEQPGGGRARAPVLVGRVPLPARRRLVRAGGGPGLSCGTARAAPSA